MPYVNHYSFHIRDRDWGHLTIKISGHPPFPAQVILNGHEYVACQARKAGIVFTKEGNCFTTPKSGSWVIATMGRIGAFDGHEHNTFDAFTSPGG
jgi:hypothetical protein